VRTTLRDVARHPSRVLSWWEDAPVRMLSFWGTLLLAEGQGWLRWAITDDEGSRWDSGLCGYVPERVVLAPPARRVWMMLQGTVATACLAARGEIEWREVGVGWQDVSYYRDPDRPRELWL
jgi:hypothetical protein